MKITRAPKIALPWSVEEHRRATQFVGLLVTICRRNALNKQKKVQSPKKNPGVRDSREPCFFEQTFYHGIIVLALYKVMTMIDTIVLTLTSDQYHISEPDKFRPSARWIENPATKTSGIQSKQNPTTAELRTGIYKPHLTLTHRINHSRKREIMLKIELSLPKLMFGNNFDELQYKDFPTIVDKLAAVLEAMGVITTAQTLAKAPLSTVHYSKNIALTDGSTPYHYLQKIKEANIKLSLDINQTDYRNEGHCYKWHSNSYEVVFYDKIKDLEKARLSDKRAIEEDSVLQLNLCETFAKRHKLEILRMEVRLNKRQKMKQLFTKLKIKTDLTFKSLFKPASAKKVLLHYLQELESKRLPLLDYRAKNDHALLVALSNNNPELGARKILQLFGLKKAFEVVTPRELRMLFAHVHPRCWYQLMADARKVKMSGVESPFTAMQEQLVSFKPLRFSRFPQRGE